MKNMLSSIIHKIFRVLNLKTVLLFIFTFFISCTKDSFDYVVDKEEQLEVLKIEEYKTSIKKKLKITVITPEPQLVCAPNHYDIFTPIETISESQYAAIPNFSGFTFMGGAIQDTFLLPNGISLENDDIFVLGLETTPPRWEETNGSTPLIFKYNDVAQRDIFGNLQWNWIDSNELGLLSATNVTDVYLSSYDKIQNEIIANPNYIEVNKLKIEINFEFNGAVTINFLVWFK